MKKRFLLTAVAVMTMVLSCGDETTGPSELVIGPSELGITVFDESAVQVYWTMCGDESFESYVLYRSLTAGIESDTASAEILGLFSDPADTVYIDEYTVEGNTYHYALMTLDDEGNGVWSNEDSIYVPSLPDISTLAVDESSSGRDVVLTWNGIQGADGYIVYFRTGLLSEWEEVEDTPDTTLVHTADISGYYAVKAHQNGFLADGYSNVVNTLPVTVSVAYTLYDNMCPPGNHDAFIFGLQQGVTGLAASPAFTQDIYAYDSGFDSERGDLILHLYSGAKPPFGNGNETYMSEPESSSYCALRTEGLWFTDYQLFAEDERVYLYLFDGYYVKMYDLDLSPDPTTARGTIVSFSYEIQSGGLTLFTDN